MEKLIRLMTNNCTMNEQTHFMENLSEILEFAGFFITCMVVLNAMAIF